MGEFSELKINKKDTLIVPETIRGVCLWKLPDDCHGGGYIASEPGVYLCMEGVIGDKRVEAKMREAAIYWLGEDVGEPYWHRGGRKVTGSEHDDQMERLQSGYIPDWEEEWREATREGRVK